MAGQTPVKIYPNNSSATGFQQMSSAEIDLVADKILYNFATNTSGVASLNITSGTGGNVGDFVDTVRDDVVGTHPSGGASTTTNYQFNQNTTQDNTSDDITYPLFVHSGDDGLQQMSGNGVNNSETINTIMSAAYTKIIASTGAVGSYFIANTASSLPGGSATGWASVGTVDDTVQKTDGSGTQTITHNLYIKQGSDPGTLSAAPVRAANGSYIQEFTNAQVNSLTKAFRNYLIFKNFNFNLSTGGAPGTGTWEDIGTINNTIRDVSDISYTRGNFSTGFQRFSSTGFQRDSSSSFARGTFSTGYTRGSFSTGFARGAFSTAYSRASSTGFARGTYSSGFSRGAFSSGYSRGTYSSGFSRGTFSSGYNRGSFQGAPGHFYNRGSFSSGFARGTYSSGFNRASSTGFARGTFSSGYSRGTFSTGFSRGTFSTGYTRTSSSGFARGTFSTGYTRGAFSTSYTRGAFSTGYTRGSFSGATIQSSATTTTYTLRRRIG